MASIQSARHTCSLSKFFLKNNYGTTAKIWSRTLQSGTTTFQQPAPSVKRYFPQTYSIYRENHFFFANRIYQHHETSNCRSFLSLSESNVDDGAAPAWRTVPTKMTSSEAFVETMVAHGTKNVFGIVGSAFMDALDIFEPAGIRFVPVQVKF